MNCDINEYEIIKEQDKNFHNIVDESINNNLTTFERNNSDDIFEIEDFTNITQFEKITFDFEIILRKWNIYNKTVMNLNKTNLNQIKWIKKSEKFLFNKKNYLIKYYYPDIDTKCDSLSNSNDSNCPNILMNKFHNNVPSFINEYGIVEWIIICPESEKDAISNKNDFILLLSCIENCDINCSLPFIIQFNDTSKRLFYGFQKGKTFKYEYKSCYLKGNLKYSELLLDIKNVLSTNFKYDTIEACDILHTCEIEYAYTKIKKKSDKFTFSNLYNKNKFLSQLFETLNYKNELKESVNVIKEFKLLFQFDGKFNNEMEDCLEDETNLFSKYKNISKWLCFTEFNDINSQFLTNILQQLFNLLNNFTLFNTSIQNILLNVNEKIIKKNFAISLFLPSDIIVNSNESIDLLLKTVTAKEVKKIQSISKEIIQTIFDFAKNPPSKSNKNKYYDDEYIFINKTLKNSKSGPSYSIVELLSLTISIILYKEKNGIIFSCILWNEFLTRLQSYFENYKYIPSISKKKHPNFNHSTLQQYIEFLQCCIHSGKKWKKVDNHQMEYGRGVKSDLTLYHHPDEYIYIPILQGKIPQTEEMFLKEMENLVETNEEERHTSLLTFLASDMSAFKTANPKCCFEDFIRWHSPNDWIYNIDNKKYELSTRMAGINNLWKKTWDKSIPLSIYKQKKYFNENKEWKKIFEKIKNITFGEMLYLILPSTLKGIIQLLFDNFKNFSPEIKKFFRRLSINFCQYTFELNKEELYQKILNDFSYIEKYVEKNYILRIYFLNSFTNENDILYIDNLLMEMAEDKIITIESDKQNLVKNLIETTFFDQNNKFFFNKQIPKSKRYIFCFYNSRIYILYSKDRTRIYSKMPISYINIKN
uniref:Rab3 GTPase-activating protein catalytic subunit n=1 Tax=Strongyloides stercoralis TaxID=6248 RepID=A0A0K0E1I2_STRER